MPDKRPGGPVTNKQQPFDTPTKARDAFIKSYYGGDNKINELNNTIRIQDALIAEIRVRSKRK